MHTIATLNLLFNFIFNLFFFFYLKYITYYYISNTIVAKVIFTAISFQDSIKVSKANRAIIFKIILQIFIIFYKITDIYIIQHILRLDGYFIIFECVCVYAIYDYLLTELISFYLNFRSDFILNIYIFVLFIFLVCFYGLFILTVMMGVMLV